MKRYLFLWVLCLVVIDVQVVAQPHISVAFELESEWTLPKDSDKIQPQGMVGCVGDDVLYFCYRRGFQDKEEGYTATITTVELSTGRKDCFSLRLPEKKVNSVIARKYWIRGICVDGGQLFLLTQSGVLAYQKGRGNRYEFVGKFDSDLPDRVSSEDGKLTVVERIPEDGRFVVRRQHDRTGMLDSVFEMRLPGPFMIQYDPNGFVKIAEGALYFLVSPELRIEKYAYNGDLQAVIEPQISEWTPMPDELVRKISAMPYSSNRAMYIFSQGKEYSFPLEISPLNDSIVLVAYHHYHRPERKEQMLSVFVHHDTAGRVKKVDGPYNHFFPQDSVIGNDAFPLYYARRELCLQVTDGNRVVQVVREAPVEWRGMTGRQYADAVDRYFADHPPVVRVRVAKLRTVGAERKCDIGDLGLQTYDGMGFQSRDFSSTKAVFIVNNPPQCHNCEASLLSLLNSADTSVCKIFVVFNSANSFLAKKDQMANVRQYLKVPFVPLFVPTEAKDAFLNEMDASVYPIVLLKEAGEESASIHLNEHIFTETLTSSALKKEFVRKFLLFLHRNDGVGK